MELRLSIKTTPKKIPLNTLQSSGQWSISLGKYYICSSMLGKYFHIAAFHYLLHDVQVTCPLNCTRTALLVAVPWEFEYSLGSNRSRFKSYQLRNLFLSRKMQSFVCRWSFALRRIFLDHTEIQHICEKDKCCSNITIALLKSFTIYVLCVFVVLDHQIEEPVLMQSQNLMKLDRLPPKRK